MTTRRLVLVATLFSLGWSSVVAGHGSHGAHGSHGGEGTPPTAQAQLAEADQVFRSRKYAEALPLYLRAAEMAEDDQDQGARVEAFSQVARCWLIQGEADKGRDWLTRAAQLASEEAPLGWSRYVGVRGRFEWKDQKDHPKAKSTFVAMYDYCMDHALHSRAIDAAHMVAIVGEPDEKIAWATKGIAAAEAGGEDTKGWLGPLWNNLGWTFDDLGRYEEMLDALKKARSYHYLGKGEQSKLVADFGVGTALHRLGRLTEARTWLEGAFAWASRRLAEKPEDGSRSEWVGWGHEKLGRLLVDEGKPIEGLMELRRARPHLLEAGIERWWPEGLQELDDRIAKLEESLRSS